MKPGSPDLPLLYRTPDAWAADALGDVMALLNDHAHLEKKAATNALELVNRWPEPSPPEHWVQSMTAIARDEVDHLAVVTRLLARRGGRMSKYHRNDYASAVRNLVCRGRGAQELVDRLMVSALIEARSCERFELLSRHSHDPELARLYADLWASENGHYRVFLDLAMRVRPRRLVPLQRRWEELLAAEAEIISCQPPGPRMHSGVPAHLPAVGKL